MPADPTKPSHSTRMIGAWRIDAAAGRMDRDGESVRIDARTLRLLLYLADNAGKVVSIDDLLDQVWTGVVVTPDSVYQGIASLRRLLRDDPKQPTYIATVPRLGYRLIAEVTPLTLPVSPPAAAAASPLADSENSDVESFPKARGPSIKRAAFMASAVLAGAIFSAVLYGLRHPGAPDKLSVGVVPFLDLTSETMDQEYFADGMTEELIDKLSKTGSLQVPSATASFYLKDKTLAVSEMARSLGVDYLLDGSVRQSDDTLRVAVRLVRARDGYVIWADSYDRPQTDKLKVQDEIATEVARNLTRSLSSPSPLPPPK